MRTETLTVRSIFDRALDIASEAERAAYLDEVCAAAPELRRKVDALLFAYASAGSFLEQPAIDREQTGVFCPVTESAGSQIGPYKLLEQIGEGGMGVVFMAEQTRPVQRRVALKIIKAGMDTREVVARFEAERQALAMMDHPNIARVFDAGSTDTGRPYFVMELVRGVPMTEFCNEKNLSIRERLELFVTVCQAVQHAHQKGIIHRDIKPTNVLVTLHDGRPMIKVIDFGVAKATGQKLTDKTLFTGFTQMIGTPLYMSPEQAEMTSQDIDTRSDIFSAGVLLYELLTGTTPFDKERLKNAAFDELRRIIREEEPPRPSTRLTTIAAEAASTVGTQRKSDPRHLSRLFRGELDWIVMKCLEKDRTRRYETASALGSDVERYLHDEPVQACPPSARYRFGKFARRNKGALTTAALVMVALVLGTVVSTWQAIRASNAEAHANTSAEQALNAAESERKAKETETVQRKRAEEIGTLLVSILRSPEPDRDGRTITVAEVLDHSAKALEHKFGDDPVTKGKLLDAIGNAYDGLGLFCEAIPLYEQARNLFIAAEGHEHSDAILAMNDLANAYADAGRLDEAIRLHEEALRLFRANLGPNADETLHSMHNLANAYEDAGRFDDALRLREETLKLTRAKLRPDEHEIVSSMNALANAYEDAGRPQEALRLWEETLKLSKAKLRPGHSDTLMSMANLAIAYASEGRVIDAVRLEEESLKLMTVRFGPEHPRTLNVMSNLACDYADARVGRLDDAVALIEKTLKISKAKLGADHPLTLVAMNNLGNIYRGAGRLDDAIRVHEESLKLKTAKHGLDHPSTLASMDGLALDYREAGRQDAELPLMDQVFKLRKDKLGPEHPDTLGSMHSLAEAYLRANRLAEAEALARECLAIRVRKRPDDWRNLYTRILLGGALLGQKRYAEAEPLLVSGYEGMHDRVENNPTFDKRPVGHAAEGLVQLYEATNQPEQAAAWKARLAEFDEAAIKEKPAVPKDQIPATKMKEPAKEPTQSASPTNK